MLKIIFIASLLFTVLTYCQEKDTTKSFNYERDTPAWLKARIDSISIDAKHYALAKVTRYEWKDKYVYHIYNGLSSCMYCELFYEDGNGVRFESEKEFQEFLKDRKDSLIVWEWNKK
jgi:hypothetical protein